MAFDRNDLAYDLVITSDLLSVALDELFDCSSDDWQWKVGLATSILKASRERLTATADAVEKEVCGHDLPS